MHKIRSLAKALAADRKAVTMLEYSIMGAMIIAAIMTFVPSGPLKVISSFNNIATTITNATQG